MKKRPIYLLCNPTSRPSAILSETRPCARCGVECWVAPSSVEVLGARPDVQVLCVGCGAPELPNAVGAGYFVLGPLSWIVGRP